MDDISYNTDMKVENFPDNIRDLLLLLTKNSGSKVTLILNTYEDCIVENVSLYGVLGSLVLIKCNDKFKFIKIDCICSVIVNCEIILNELLESSTCNMYK